MSTNERQLLLEAAKLRTIRERITATVYLTPAEVRAHLKLSAHALESIPRAVLPWVPLAGRERTHRRYHPADVAAYPARVRRWRAGGDEALSAMERELAERDRALIADALGAA